MNKTNLQTLKGFRDFLPEVAKKRQYLITKIRSVFELFGFEPLETPALEYKDILLGKSGEETEKQVYIFKDKGGRDVALRFDQTVPTARVLGMYQNTLPLPFRRYQIQNAWRAENPQAGRFREFMQCDADIYGSTSPLADAEIIALSSFIYKSLGFNNFKIFINDRKILTELMIFANIPADLHFAVISAIDKLDRKSENEIQADLAGLGLNEDSIKHLFHHLSEAAPNDNLKSVTEYTLKLGVDEDKLKFQARLARGLDYYTGTIFEIKIDEYKTGSVLGGGRYDELIEKLSGISIPAVGFGLGFDRTLEAMDELKLIPDKGKRRGILVSVFNNDLLEKSIEITKILRESNFACEVFPNEEINLEKQLKYADKKGLKWLLVIGPEEAGKNSVILKDLETGHQEDVKIENLINKLGSNE